MHTLARAAIAGAIGLIAATPCAHAHGFAGKRFFPGTIATEDPAAADELALPTISSRDGETSVAAEYSKRITRTLALSLEGAWMHAEEDGETLEGFGNLETGLKWQFFTSGPHETILAAGVGVEWGGTGANRIGAEETTTIAPAFYFGRGFGDAGAEWLRPFAVTGSAAYVIPTQARDDEGEVSPHVVEAGFTLQYSLPYQTAHVRDLGLPAWMNRLTPIVEVALEIPVTHRGEERTTGTINPGMLWSGRRVQLGAEAIIPINDESGDDIGWAVQLHYFIDDIFAHSFGRPLIGGAR